MPELVEEQGAPGQPRMATLRQLLAVLDELDFPVAATPDRESHMRYGDESYEPAELVVTSGTRRVLIKVSWSARHASDLLQTSNLSELQRLLERVPQADAAIMVQADPPSFLSVLVDGFSMASAVESPLGTRQDMPRVNEPQPLRQVLRQYLEPRESWPDLPPPASLPLEQIGPSAEELDSMLQTAAEELRERGARARTDLKIDAWTSISARDLAWVVSVVEAMLSGRVDPQEVGAVLHQRSRSRPTSAPKVQS